MPIDFVRYCSDLGQSSQICDESFKPWFFRERANDIANIRNSMYKRMERKQIFLKSLVGVNF